VVDNINLTNESFCYNNSKILQIDIETFKFLNKNCAKDKNFVYDI